MLAITIVSWAGFARLVRGLTLSLKEQTYVEASAAIGATTGRILFRHILPMRCRSCSWQAAFAWEGSSCSRLPSRSSVSASSRHTHVGLDDQFEQDVHQFRALDGHIPRARHQHYRDLFQYPG